MRRARRNPEPAQVPPFEVYAAREIAEERSAREEAGRAFATMTSAAEAGDVDPARWADLDRTWWKATVRADKARRQVARSRLAWRWESAAVRDLWIIDAGTAGFSVAYGPDGRTAIDCRPFPAEDLPRCRRGLHRAARRLDRADLGLFYVHSSVMPSSLLGTGLGTRAYVMAAREAARRGAVLAPDWCRRGSTSGPAWRVWNGRLFRSQVRMFDDVAWGGEVPAGKRPTKSPATAHGRTNPRRRHR